MTNVKIDTQEIHKINDRHLQRNLKSYRVKMMALTRTGYKEHGSPSAAMAVKCHRHSNQGLGNTQYAKVSM